MKQTYVEVSVTLLPCMMCPGLSKKRKLVEKDECVFSPDTGDEPFVEFYRSTRELKHLLLSQNAPSINNSWKMYEWSLNKKKKKKMKKQ